MKKQYDYILLDLDGTITDPKEGITKSFQLGLRHFGIEEDRESLAKKVIGPPLLESFMTHWNLSREQAAEAVKVYREYYGKGGVFDCFLYEGIEELLKSLTEAGKQVFLATSKPTYYADQILEHFHIKKYFSFVGGSLLDNTRTQKTEVIEHVFSENHITDRSKAVMVGDTAKDITGAKLSGIDSIGVLYGYGTRADIEKEGPTVILEDVQSLREYLL